MPPRPPRHTLVPNANNVQLLTRLLELVAQGVREPRSLSELLDCEVRTVHYYTQAGEWLGMLEPGQHARLTALGLEFVYAGSDRPEVYARAAWSNDLVRDLMQGRGADLPETDDIAWFLRRLQPGMADSTSYRRATSVHALLAPAMRFRRRALKAAQVQLALPFPVPSDPEPMTQTQVSLRGDSGDEPEVYRIVLGALLDHGELAPGHLRALLDRSGARDVPVGDCMQLALQRGDAHRIQDRLVVSQGAVRRGQLTETAVGVALSDPGYRDYLTAVGRSGQQDPDDSKRMTALVARYAGWDRRVFGGPADPTTLAGELDRVLMGQRLASFPLAGEAGPKPPPQKSSFLDAIEQPGLVLALPPALILLLGSVKAVNRLLEGGRREKNAVRLPHLAEVRHVVHGGLLHPGESVPRAIPDTVSLRLRVLCNVPHLALLCALLVLHRQAGPRVEVLIVDGELRVLRIGEDLGELLGVLDSFAHAQGWIVARRARRVRGALRGHDLARVLEALGVAVTVRDRLLLEERFFVRLRSEPEDRELHQRLKPLVDRMLGWIEEYPP
jgi:hypothetical protein